MGRPRARADVARARAEGGAPGLHEHVRHLGEIRVEVFRLRSRGGGGPGRRRVVSGRGVGAVFFGASATVRAARANRGARPRGSPRTVLDGVMFFAFASAFIALSVSLRPFASRYASTAGTRSAAFAAIVEEGADSRDGAPQRSVQQAPQQAPRVSAPKSGAGVEGKKGHNQKNHLAPKQPLP